MRIRKRAFLLREASKQSTPSHFKATNCVSKPCESIGRRIRSARGIVWTLIGQLGRPQKDLPPSCFPPQASPFIAGDQTSLRGMPSSQRDLHVASRIDRKGRLAALCPSPVVQHAHSYWPSPAERWVLGPCQPCHLYQYCGSGCHSGGPHTLSKRIFVRRHVESHTPDLG